MHFHRLVIPWESLKDVLIQEQDVKGGRDLLFDSHRCLIQYFIWYAFQELVTWTLFG
jgi:hypothetical protein